MSEVEVPKGCIHSLDWTTEPDILYFKITFMVPSETHALRVAKYTAQIMIKLIDIANA